MATDQPVFASGRGPKGKIAVRLGVLALIALVTVWLTALILGALGFGNLPDLHLPGARGSTGSKDKAFASTVPPGLTGAINAQGLIAANRSGSNATTGAGSGSGGGTSGGSSSGSGGTSSGTGNGNGRGTPTGTTGGGRGAPVTTPNGKNTPGNGHGKGKGLIK